MKKPLESSESNLDDPKNLLASKNDIEGDKDSNPDSLIEINKGRESASNDDYLEEKRKKLFEARRSALSQSKFVNE